VVGGNMVLDRERVEQRALRHLPRPHHLHPSPTSERVNQAGQATAIAGFSTASAHTGHSTPKRR
jgi:hypothetical protein